MTRRAANIDALQPEIVKAARSIGATVQTLAGVGKGCPDLVIGWQGRNYLVEVKSRENARRMGKGVPSATKLTELEQKWHDAWRGQVAIVETVEDLLSLLLKRTPEVEA